MDTRLLSFNLKNIMGKKNQFIKAGILFLGFMLSISVFQNQQNKIRNLRIEFIREEQRTGLAKEVVSLSDKINQISALYLKGASSLSIDKFNDFASQSKVKIIKLTPGRETDFGDYAVMSFSVSLRADYHSLGRFLSILESQEEMIRVEQITVSFISDSAKGRLVRTEEKKENALDINMTVSTVYIKAR